MMLWFGLEFGVGLVVLFVGNGRRSVMRRSLCVVDVNVIVFNVIGCLWILFVGE